MLAHAAVVFASRLGFCPWDGRGVPIEMPMYHMFPLLITFPASLQVSWSPNLDALL